MKLSFSKVQIIPFVCGSIFFLLTGCTRGSPVDFHAGTVSMTGTVIPVEVSLIRRGTHALVVDGKSKFYLESKNSNLKSYEGQTVFVKGEAQANVRSEDLPVIVVESLQTAYGHEKNHIWEVPTLNLRIDAPETWNAKIEKGIVTFYLDSGSSPLLTVSTTSSGSLPEGISLYIAGRRGIRTSREKDLIQDVYFIENDSVVHLHFDASSQKSVQRVEEAQILLSQFENILSSLKFLTDTSSSATLTGSGTGIPCGGTAGVLCPSGYFCDITDEAHNIGNCRNF